jgi:CheY-like chemotaxis protein
MNSTTPILLKNPAVQPRPPRRRPPEAMPIRILHVEDCEIISSVVRDGLMIEGWQVECCETAEDAIEKLDAIEHFDVILLDYDLPGLNGIELAAYVRKLPRYRMTPILMFSGSAVEDEAEMSGIDAFLRKPDGILELAATTKRYLTRQRCALA